MSISAIELGSMTTRYLGKKPEKGPTPSRVLQVTQWKLLRKDSIIVTAGTDAGKFSST